MLKKLVVVLMALLFVTGALVAQEEGLTDKLAFKYGGMLYIYNTRQTAGADPIAFWETRLRQYLSVGNKNIEVMVKLEMDPTWGYAASGSDNVNLEADMKGELQIKNAYLRFTAPSTPFTVKAGVLFHMSPGMFMFANDFGGITVNYKLGGMVFNGMYGKMSEMTDNQFDDDAEIFGATFTLGGKGMKITPAVYYIYKGASVQTGANYGLGGNNFHGVYTRNAFIPQVNLTMKSDNMFLCATVAYGLGTIKDSGPNDIDASGLGIDVKFKFNLSKNMSVGLRANFLTGDDAGSTDKFESFAQFMPGYVAERGVRLTAASIFLQGGLTAHPNEDIGRGYVYNNGLLLLAGNFCMNAGKLSLKASLIWLNATEEYAASAKAYGLEADFIVEYSLYKNLLLQVEASFFKPSTDFKADTGLPDLYTFWAVGTSFKW